MLPLLMKITFSRLWINEDLVAKEAREAPEGLSAAHHHLQITVAM
jgi:hypothetical protein